MLIAITPEAAAQVAALERWYAETLRPQALRSLGHALAEASLTIVNAPERGLPAPRPYPELAALELPWLKRGRYWMAFDASVPIIAGIFFETSEVPGRAG